MRQLVLILLLLCVAPAGAQVSVSIGINVPVYPQLVRVPGYPVYYAPDQDWNYFFYDGMYWVYQDDYWYTSDWYNGPWDLVEPDFVPLFVLRVPVRYYRRPPMYFRGWQPDRPPHWGDHWGNAWSQHRSGWDHWDRHAMPAPAPLPTYQRQYAGNRYPRADQQPALRNQNYRYQPRDTQVRQREQLHGQGKPVVAPAKQEVRQDRPDRNPTPHVNQREQAPQPNRQNTPEAPRNVPPQPSRNVRPQPVPATTEAAPPKRDTSHEQRRPEQRNEQRPQPTPATRSPNAVQHKQAPRPEQNPGQGSDREKDRGNDRGRDH